MSVLTAFLVATISSGTPLLFATLGEILTEKVGNLNLGVEGMMMLGASFAFVVGLATQNPGLALLCGMAAGGIGGLIYAFLTVSLRANSSRHRPVAHDIRRRCGGFHLQIRNGLHPAHRGHGRVSACPYPAAW